ncbi:oligomeric complex COG6-domain-containing protein [Apodospora peruviana]|uniref:Conserved oligomeric Golgi complex subunit 6 n=1 Tax=Apodospora peruviana TaxID=516989 RepID=A0AAE0IBH2_9PEZI|nr:oligomeric complex COG6-domain-containing protein [Apodospora peruviana]
MTSQEASDFLRPPLPPSSPSTRGVNPLSAKVASVLSTSYADTEFREALALLDDRGLQNTAESRRKLRLDLQKEVIDSNGEIITEFAKVAEQLRRIGNTIGKLNESYLEMKTQIGAAHDATSSVLAEASQLMTQRRQVERKQNLLKAFNASFVLSEDEVAALTLTSEPVDDLFFAVLSKAKKTSKDCEVLLGFEDQTLGLEIMDQVSRNLNQGFQKLYRWIQKEFKTINLENPQIGSSIRRALRVLAERPTLFQNCLDFFAEAREHVLSDSFYTALTGGSASGVEDPSVKPIELVAHDPLRYVGDMLAWSHSAAVSEKEALEILFISEGDEIAKGIQAGRDSEVWRLTAEDGADTDVFDAVTALNELVDRDMSGAVRILRQRVEQVIQTNEDTILAYKLANLLNFYKTTFSRMLEPGSVFVESMGLLESEALRQFRSLARDHVATLQGDFQHTPFDLRPPDFLLEALGQLMAIMKTYETSLTSSGDREAEFEPILAEALDPFISGCVNMAHTVTPPSNSIFLINCFLAAKHTLSGFDFTGRRTAELQRKIDEGKTQLIESQYVFFRVESGLDSLIESLGALRENEDDVQKVSSLQAVQSPALSRASQILDDFLPSALMDAMENIRHLQDSKLARDITEEAAERFCVDFEHVEEMLVLADDMTYAESNEAEEAQSLRALFPRTSGEIRVLLSLWPCHVDDHAMDWLSSVCTLTHMLVRRAAAHDIRTYENIVTYGTVSTTCVLCSTVNCSSLVAVRGTIGPHYLTSTMLRNRTAASVLQKTYDESYLTCSTAVYYEGQGNEDEAMRCWKLALDQIYDHHANRVIPNYTPCSETEKALVESLRRLELQCKERVDLLEALRLSRQETAQQDSTSSGSRPTTSSDFSDPAAQEKGWIGAGTVPAVTYTQLSRPALPPRPPLPTRIASEQVAGVDRGTVSEDLRSSSSRSLATPPPMPSPERRASRSASPERHTMRTTLRTNRPGDKSSKSGLRGPSSKPVDGPGASKAATLAWSALGHRAKANQWPVSTGSALSLPPDNSPLSVEQPRRSSELSQRQWDRHSRRLVTPRTRSPTKLADDRPHSESAIKRYSDDYSFAQPSPLSIKAASSALNASTTPLTPEGERISRQKNAPVHTPRRRISENETNDGTSYFGEVAERDIESRLSLESASISRKPVGQPVSAGKTRNAARSSAQGSGVAPVGSKGRRSQEGRLSSSSSLEDFSYESRPKLKPNKRKTVQREAPLVVDSLQQPSGSSDDDDTDSRVMDSWKKRKAAILKKVPPGIDDLAAKQILNEIVVQGDDVHWGDIAGLEVAKNALRETVVYPFLRPDLFMGLREPARGMLLFGPPGTGKTMLARAVATESKSTFFSISASSLTSKYLGESEKLVRALFVLAKLLAPSIIFVDEIDSLLSQRSGSGEHEATRRIKTEFLIQWSDLQRAAAGREVTDREKDRGDANRVLVLAATNLPWAIDEAARRRFVRRQYIPLPEAETRAVQLKTLLSQQKHTLTDADIQELVRLTDGFSGSDITALAKDAAMGPLRSLGEALLHMTMDEIRPIGFADFIASLTTIRPSVSKTGLKQYEEWAAEFGERGG